MESPNGEKTNVGWLLVEGKNNVDAATGGFDTKGQIQSKTFSALSTNYTSGVTRVMIIGRIASVDESVAKATIGRLSIDYSSTLATHGISISRGMLVAVSGTQAAQGSVLQAEKVTLVTLGK